jgi:hypothetical protein
MCHLKVELDFLKLYLIGHPSARPFAQRLVSSCRSSDTCRCQIFEEASPAKKHTQSSCFGFSMPRV